MQLAICNESLKLLGKDSVMEVTQQDNPFDLLFPEPVSPSIDIEDYLSGTKCYSVIEKADILGRPEEFLKNWVNINTALAFIGEPDLADPVYIFFQDAKGNFYVFVRKQEQAQGDIATSELEKSFSQDIDSIAAAHPDLTFYNIMTSDKSKPVPSPAPERRREIIVDNWSFLDG